MSGQGPSMMQRFMQSQQGGMDPSAYGPMPPEMEGMEGGEGMEMPPMPPNMDPNSVPPFDPSMLPPGILPQGDMSNIDPALLQQLAAIIAQIEAQQQGGGAMGVDPGNGAPQLVIPPPPGQGQGMPPGM